MGKLEKKNLITVVQKAPFRMDENINESLRKKVCSHLCCFASLFLEK